MLSEAGGLESRPTPRVVASAWAGTRTILATTDLISVSERGQSFTCALTQRPIVSVGLSPSSVLWTDYVDPEASSALVEAALTSTGCEAPRRVAALENAQLAYPSRRGDDVLALIHNPSLQSQLTAFSSDGGVRSPLRFPGPSRTCHVAESILIATAQTLFRFDQDAGLTQLSRFDGTADAFDCNGLTWAIGFNGDAGGTIVKYGPSGETSRTSVSAHISGLGLSSGEWVVADNLVRRWSGELLETISTSHLTDAWHLGDETMVSIGAGTLLRHEGTAWSPVTTPREVSYRELPDGRGGVLQLFLNGDTGLELWDENGRALTLPPPRFTTEPGVESQVWMADSCSDDLLLGVRYDRRDFLAFRRGGAWQLLPLPVASYRYATVESDQLVVGVDRQTIIRRSLGGAGEWSEENAGSLLPASSGRILPSRTGLVIEVPEGIELRSGDEVRLVAPAGARLLGVSNGWVSWSTGNGLSVSRADR